MKTDVYNPWMHVFISWSGERSRTVAEALRDWIPMVLQSVDVWISSSDMDKGTQWGGEIARQLDSADMGIVCLTPENLAAPWILFEAGAISKHVAKARVCTYLLDLQPQDVVAPLSLFQHTLATAEDTKQLLNSINSALDKPLSANIIDRLFIAMWPQMETRLQAIINKPTVSPPRRSSEDMIAELLEISRARSGVQGVENILAKLELIEIAMFMLSIRSMDYAPLEGIAFNILDASRKKFKSGDPTVATQAGAWDVLANIVERHVKIRAEQALKTKGADGAVPDKPASGAS